MSLKALLLMASLATATVIPLSLQHHNEAFCGVHTASPGLRARHMEIEKRHSLQRRDDDDEPITIKTFFHASVPSTVNETYASEETMQKQYEVLRDSFAPYGFNFELGAITREVNDHVTNLTSPIISPDLRLLGSNNSLQEEWWKSQRVGRYQDLHVFYYYSLLGAGGFCGLPLPDRKASHYWLDACHLTADALVGGVLEGFPNGGATVHEVGHWLGLLHVFGETCTEEDGDMVADTPIQLISQPGTCVEGKDTCPDQPGVDSIHNIMDYSGDDCATEFTPGQVKRMKGLWSGIRAGN